MIEQANTLN